MQAYHFLKDDMTATFGGEPPWTEGEERTRAATIAARDAARDAEIRWQREHFDSIFGGIFA